MSGDKEIKKMEKTAIQDFMEIGIAFLVAFIVYQGLVFATGTQVPVVSVASDSMLPKLHKGDLVFAVKPDNLSVGDIIIYHANCVYMPNRDIIHRINSFRDGKIITKGDNNPGPDPCPVEYSQVKGKVVLGIPLLGWPRLGLSYLIGF